MPEIKVGTYFMYRQYHASCNTCERRGNGKLDQKWDARSYFASSHWPANSSGHNPPSMFPNPFTIHLKNLKLYHFKIFTYQLDFKIKFYKIT